MGNRAVITTKDRIIGIYLHWNGGRDSVEGFLTFCKLAKYRPPEKDSYGWAYLCGVITNFFGKEGLSVGIDILKNLDCNNGDNGVYIIENWEIVGRAYSPNGEQYEYSLLEVLTYINSKMPEHMKLPEDVIEKECYNK